MSEINNKSDTKLGINGLNEFKDNLNTEYNSSNLGLADDNTDIKLNTVRSVKVNNNINAELITSRLNKADNIDIVYYLW